MARFLVTADIHANKTRLPKVLQFFDKCIDIIKEQKIDYFVIAGDLWNAAIQNTKASGFVDIENKLHEISKLTHIISIMGTPSHEPNGSNDFLIPFGADVVISNTLLEKDGIKILCIPEPRRSEYIKSTAKETTEAILEDLNFAFNSEADLVFFHGEISGASLDNGTKAKSDIQVTQEMFKRCGAKLMLAGHIHTPQNVFKNANYLGSPIPCTFGETHNGTVTMFDYDDGVKNITKIPLGFPQNKMLDVDNLDMFNKLDKLNFKNNNIKIRLKLSPEEKLTFNIREECKKLKEATNAEDVIINVSTKDEVSIRSSEIHKATSNQDKLKIYADVNNIQLTDEILNKLKDIEDSLLIEYISPTHSFELLSLSLRGAKGVKNTEEVNIDFTKFEEGVVALIGSNGSGKTTILENCSPYPKLLTRSGALRSHFYLKDSHRIVIYKDENDIYYRFTIQLAAHIDTGLVKYFVETSEDKGETWKSVQGVDGSLDAYNEYLKGTFGSVEIYLRTAFFTKGKVKGVNDIASATKGEKIELLSSLLGLDNLSTIHDIAKDKLKAISKEIESLDSVDEKFNVIEQEISKKKQSEKMYSDDLAETEQKLSEIESLIKNTKIAEENFNKNYAKYGNVIEMKNNCENEIAEITDHLFKLKEHKAKNDYFINHKKQIDEYKVEYERLSPLQAEFDKINKKYIELSEELVEATGSYNELKSKREVEINKLESVDGRIKSAEDNIIPIDDFCPTCGAKLSATKKKELAKAQSYQLAELQSLKDFKESQKKIVSDIKKSFTTAKNRYEKAVENKKKYKEQFDDIDARLQALKVYLDMNDYSDFIDYVQVSNLEEDIKRFTDELNRNYEFLKTFEGVEIKNYKAELEELEAQRKKEEQFRLDYSVGLASIQTEIKQLEEQLQSMKDDVERIKGLSKDYEEYSVLEQAFSNSGIQALELEAAVPDIALLTNQILSESYGDKFSVSFKTLKESRNKIIDDFSIEVTNHETGWTTPIELLSEGEKIWIVQSLQFAFSLVRMERTGFSFRVRFIDESDGSLDSEARLKYVNMINSAHRNGNSRLTLLVTHSQEVKDIVTQTIQL